VKKNCRCPLPHGGALWLAFTRFLLVVAEQNVGVLPDNIVKNRLISNSFVYG
jgi:hypothetical protein